MKDKRGKNPINPIIGILAIPPQIGRGISANPFQEGRDFRPPHLPKEETFIPFLKLLFYFPYGPF